MNRFTCLLITAIRISIVIICVFIAFTANAQNIQQFKDIKVNKDSYENVKVIPLYTDSEVSSFIIFVKKDVRLHYHAVHTEQVYILAGKGEMTIDGKKVKIKKGDYLVFPKGMPHGVKVTSRKPMKVWSIQAPEFKGEDRIFVAE